MVSAASCNLPETFVFKLWHFVLSLNPGQKREDRAMTFAVGKIHLPTHCWLLPALAIPLAESEKPRPGNSDRQRLLTIADVAGTRGHDSETVPAELDTRAVVAVDN